MSRRLGCVPLLALMVLNVPPASGAERATLISNVRFDELVGWCEDADAAKRSACSSYVLGVIDGRAVVDVEIGRRVLCYPDGADLSVVVETIVAELKDGFRSDISPEQRMAPAAIPVQSIAQKHYACPPAATRLELRPASYDPAGSLSEMKVPGTGESIYVADRSAADQRRRAFGAGRYGDGRTLCQRDAHIRGSAPAAHMERDECRPAAGHPGGWRACVGADHPGAADRAGGLDHRPLHARGGRGARAHHRCGARVTHRRAVRRIQGFGTSFDCVRSHSSYSGRAASERG